MMRRRRCVVGFSACAAWPFRILSAPPHPVLAWVRSRVLLVDALAITLSVNFAPEDGWRRRTVMGVGHAQLCQRVAYYCYYCCY